MMKDKRECNAAVTALNYGISNVEAEVVDFMWRHPLPADFPRLINTEAGVIKKDSSIFICIFGISDFTLEYLITSLATDRYLCEGECGHECLKISYLVIPRDCDEQERICSRLEGLRYRSFFIEHRGDDNYLSFPDFRESITVCSYDDALVSIAAHLGENDSVRLVADALAADREQLAALAALSGAAYFRGEIKPPIQNAESINRINDPRPDSLDSIPPYVMSAARAYVYECESDMGKDSELDITHIPSYLSLSGKSRYEIKSTVASCLSVRAKLILMGLDAVPCDGEGRALSYGEYMSIYARNDMPDEDSSCKAMLHQPWIRYGAHFPLSLRRTMAELEHLRWCGNLLVDGYLPASIAEITEEKVDGRYTNGKNKTERRHGNLVDFSALPEFSRIIAERDGRSALECDVIKYDYQLLDYLYAITRLCGMKIINKIDR